MFARHGLSIVPDINLVANIGFCHPEATHKEPTADRLVVPSRAMELMFAFSAVSILRLVFVIVRSVYHNGTARAPIKPLVPNSGSISVNRLASGSVHS